MTTTAPSQPQAARADEAIAATSPDDAHEAALPVTAADGAQLAATLYLPDGSPVGLVADFAQCDFPGGIPPLTGKLDELVRCWFLDTDPRDCWDRFAGLAEAVADGGKGSLALAAPFIATVPGTTRYLDELW